MSQNYRRLQPPAGDFQPDLGTHTSSDHRPSRDYSFYREPLKPSSHLSSSSSYPLPSSSRASVEPSYSIQRSASDLSILSSCGLEPSDLSLLAELPEDALTLESLPQLLKEIKDKKEKEKHYSSTQSSSHLPGPSHPPAASCSSDWERIRNQPVQYPLAHAYVTPKPLPPEQVQDWQDRWGNPRQTGFITYQALSSTEAPPPPPPSSSSSSSYKVDYDHQERPTEHGKKRTNSSPISGYSRSSHSSRSAGDRGRNPPSLAPKPGSVDYRSARPAKDHRSEGQVDHCEPDASRTSSKRRLSTNVQLPSLKAALDFLGTTPVTYPYSCALCDITALSEKFWIKHINGTQHADGQLNLLQRYPDWDCRLETIKRGNEEPEKLQDEGTSSMCPQETKKGRYQQPNKSGPKKPTANSKVVCVKFSAQTLDEKFLKSLIEPFGKMVKVIMFPSLAYVEMGSSDQAKDLVTYYSSNPVSVKGEEVVVFIASTFNFLQSSQVLRFTPAPTGKDGQSDLISITKRFGLPLYTLFLPSQAFVEMKNEADAQKLVDYYSSNTLRMNGQVIKVAFSAEYNSLMRVSLAKKYQEESSTRKRSKSRSPQSERKDSRQYKRRRSREREEKDKEIKRENERRTRSSSSSRTSRSGRSRSREGRYLEKTATPETIQPTKRQSETSEPAPSNPSKPGARLNTAPREEAEETADLSGEESDIEGMEVIGEDGENLMDDEVEALDETEGEEERAADVEEERSKDEEGRSGDEQGRLADEEEEKADVADVAEKDEEEKVKQKDEGEEGMELGDVMQEEKEVEEQARSAEAPEQKVTPELVTDIPSVNGPELQGSAGMAPPQEDESEINEAPDFPLDLENCITLDEIRDEESDDQDQKDDVDEPEVSREGDAEEYHSSSTRVISLTNLPQMVYTDNEFIKIVKGFGTVTRYLLIQKHGEGFLEMSSSAEASRAAQELTSKAFEFHGSVLTVQLSDKYERLTDGTTVQSDVSSDEDREEHRTSGSRSSGQSNASESEDCVNQSTAKEESATADSAEDAEARENQACDLVEVQPSPAESIVEPMKPTKPVGAEFVRPVVGYFCNLCKVIYADEDEAKTEHCSSLSHYQKYKEHTGKDPLAS